MEGSEDASSIFFTVYDINPKNGEEDLEYAHKPCARYTKEHGTIYLLICISLMLVNKKTIVQCLFMFLLLLRDVAVSD